MENTKTQALAYGLGLRRYKGEKTLDVTYPEIIFGSEHELLNTAAERLGYSWQDQSLFQIAEAAFPDLAQLCVGTPFESLTQSLTELGLRQPDYGGIELVLFVLQDVSLPVTSAEEAFFKLHLLSRRQVKPRGLNLEQAFAVLNNIAWSNQGPILPEDLDLERTKALLKGQNLNVTHIDKFPYLVNYHIPTGVRIASGSQVRLGAYLGEGTTVMPAGYVNFNAGTAGQAMVEGRISAGVFVGDHTDIGGGASIMGTLSGGNQHVISIGEACLLGANAGLGISLGNGCTIAAGLYIYAGMKISLYDLQGVPVDLLGQPVLKGENIVKASELSGRDHLLFIQDSQTGEVICRPNPRTITLNTELHTHN